MGNSVSPPDALKREGDKVRTLYANTLWTLFEADELYKEAAYPGDLKGLIAIIKDDAQREAFEKRERGLFAQNTGLLGSRGTASIMSAADVSTMSTVVLTALKRLLDEFHNDLILHAKRGAAARAEAALIFYALIDAAKSHVDSIIVATFDRPHANNEARATAIVASQALLREVDLNAVTIWDNGHLAKLMAKAEAARKASILAFLAAVSVLNDKHDLDTRLLAIIRKTGGHVTPRLVHLYESSFKPPRPMPALWDAMFRSLYVNQAEVNKLKELVVYSSRVDWTAYCREAFCLVHFLRRALLESVVAALARTDIQLDVFMGHAVAPMIAHIRPSNEDVFSLFGRQPNPFDLPLPTASNPLVVQLPPATVSINLGVVAQVLGVKPVTSESILATLRGNGVLLQRIVWTPTDTDMDPMELEWVHLRLDHWTPILKDPLSTQLLLKPYAPVNSSEARIAMDRAAHLPDANAILKTYRMLRSTTRRHVAVPQNKSATPMSTASPAWFSSRARQLLYWLAGVQGVNVHPAWASLDKDVVLNVLLELTPGTLDLTKFSTPNGLRALAAVAHDNYRALWES